MHDLASIKASVPSMTIIPYTKGIPNTDKADEEIARVTLKTTLLQDKNKIGTITDSKDASNCDQQSWYKDLDSEGSSDNSNDRISEQIMGEPRPTAPTTIVREKRRRMRMTKEQSRILEDEFQRDPNWTTAKIKTIAERV